MHPVLYQMSLDPFLLLKIAVNCPLQNLQTAVDGFIIFQNLSDLTVCQVQSAVQNQNALLHLRQSRESLGHKLVVDM